MPPVGWWFEHLQVEIERESERKGRALLFLFIGMILIGSLNRIYSKLQTIPLQNYPLTINFYCCVVYLVFYFAYILPTIRWGTAISRAERAVSWKVFAVMGGLDAIASIMQTFAFNYIASGALLILLMQSAIPVSMVVSKVWLKTQYKVFHYLGALVVIGGLVVVLLPKLLHPAAGSNELVWCGVLVGSCIPMALNAVYKEKALGRHNMNGMYLNGWVAFYQFWFSIVLSVPSIYAQHLTLRDLPTNVWDGFRCFVGTRRAVVAPCCCCFFFLLRIPFLCG